MNLIYKKWCVFIFLMSIYSCSKDNIKPEPPVLEDKTFEVNESLVSVMNHEDSLLIKSVENYVIRSNDSNYNPLDSWFYADSLSIYPYFELLKNVRESNRIQVLALTSEKGYKEIKLAFLNGTNIETILNIPALPSKDMGYILLNYYDTYRRVKSQQFGNIRYFNHSTYQINPEEVNKMLAFGKQLSAFFKISELKFDYYIFDNSKDLYATLGYEYGPYMYDAYQANSFARPADLSVFIGSSTAYNPHELTHLYVHSFIGATNPNVANPNSLLDEGFATYFGGAQGGYSLKQSTLMALNYYKLHEVCFEEIENLGFLIEDIVNFKNVFYGNFVKYLIEYYSPEYALQVLSSYNTDEELNTLLKSKMVNDETFNEFVIRILLTVNPPESEKN